MSAELILGILAGVACIMIGFVSGFAFGARLDKKESMNGH